MKTLKTDWLKQLQSAVEQHPIAILRFDDNEWERLLESLRGFSEFTVARPSELLTDIKVPTICLIQANTNTKAKLYFGILNSKGRITTLDTRVKVKAVQPITPDTQTGLIRLISEKIHSTNLRTKLQLDSAVISLSPKLSSYLLERLASLDQNRRIMEGVSRVLLARKEHTITFNHQEDALELALKAFGLTKEARAASIYLRNAEETALSQIAINEDGVIEHDARQIPGFELVDSDVTGQAIFERGNERLEVFTANRRPLEQVFGVDLIYFNQSQHSIVMIQYKMLECVAVGDGKHDWVYRPDGKFKREIDRMRKFLKPIPENLYEYRLNSDVFYLKFVRRDALAQGSGIIIPIAHYEKMSEDPKCQGPRQGVRVSFDSVTGHYLRETPFLHLIRSGYIGAYAKTTEYLMFLVRETLKNNRALLAAIQKPVETA